MNQTSIPNVSGIHPAGHCILVQPKEVEQTSQGGIVLATATQNRREEMGQTEATVIELGACAYKDQPSPWCKPGDSVVFARYAGIERRFPDGRVYRIISDLDVKAVIEQPKAGE